MLGSSNSYLGGSSREGTATHKCKFVHRVALERYDWPTNIQLCSVGRNVSRRKARSFIKKKKTGTSSAAFRTPQPAVGIFNRKLALRRAFETID